MSKPKILELCAVDTTVKNLLSPLIDYLSDNGFEVTALCSEGPFTNELKDQGYNIKNIEIKRNILSINNLFAIFKIAKYIKKENFDIIHVHTPIASVIGRAAAKIAGVPIVAYTAHGFYFHENMNFLSYNFILNIEKFFGKFFTDYIFTQSREDMQTAIEKNIIDNNSIETIGNGVDPSIFDPKSKNRNKLKEDLGFEINDIVICFVGRLVEEKGIFELVEAFEKISHKYNRAKLLIVGDSLTDRDTETKGKLYNLIDEKKLQDSIYFYGYSTDVENQLAASDIFVLPSYREGMPRSIIEAMMMSLPVIATNIRGCREEVKDKETGFLVEVQDENMLQDKLEILLNDEDLRKQLGSNGRKRALELYDEEKVLNRQLIRFKQLLNI